MKNSKKVIKGIAVILSAFMFFQTFPVGIPANASTESDLQAKINALQKQLNSISSDQKNEKQYQSTLNAQIDALNEQLKVYQGQYDDLNNQINSQSTQIMQINDGIQEKNQKIEETQNEAQKTLNMLKGKIRNNYMSGGFSWLNALLSSTGFSDFASKWEYVKCAAQRDQELKQLLEQQVETTKNEKASLESLKTDLQAKKAALQDQQNKLASVKNNIQQTENNVNGKLKESLDTSKHLSREYAQTQAEKQKAQQALKEAQAAADAAADAAASGGSGGGGNTPSSSGYICPLPKGSYHVSCGFSSEHQAVDLAAPRGTVISAAASGKVITVQYWNGSSISGMQSYGNMVQILHDDGSSTLYAHCNSINVSQGQYVQQGQQIATVGTTGYSTGNHLHFELRINKHRVNPLNYI